LGTYHPGTLYLRKQECEDLWLCFEAKRGPRAKTFRNNDLRNRIYFVFVELTAVRQVERQVSYRVDSFTKNVEHRGRSEWVLVPWRFGHHRFYKNAFYL